MNRKSVRISLEDYTRYPSGRNKSDGPYSGEHFKEEILNHFRIFDEVIINLDGVAGLPHSFIDGCFGPLNMVLKNKIILESKESPDVIKEIYQDYFFDFSLFDEIKKIALKHCKDYPNIEKVDVNEQLYAIDCTLEGLNLAIDDWFKFCKYLIERYNIPKYEVENFYIKEVKNV